jgi:hypothetical protein
MHELDDKKFWDRRCTLAATAGSAEAAHDARQYIESFKASENDAKRLANKGFTITHRENEPYLRFVVPPEQLDAFLANLGNTHFVFEDVTDVDKLTDAFANLSI